MACEYQEKTGRRSRFTDLVSFVEKQTKIVSHPVFGHIQDNKPPKDNTKLQWNRSKSEASKERKNAFAIVVPEPKKQRAQKGTAVQSKLCPCCSNEHRRKNFVTF